MKIYHFSINNNRNNINYSVPHNQSNYTLPSEYVLIINTSGTDLYNTGKFCSLDNVATPRIYKTLFFFLYYAYCYSYFYFCSHLFYNLHQTVMTGELSASSAQDIVNVKYNIKLFEEKLLHLDVEMKERNKMDESKRKINE